MRKLLGLVCIFMLSISGVFAYNGKSFDSPIQACVNHILVPTEEQAQKIKTEIRSFEDFQQYAKIYSECPSGRNGGNLGCFGHGQMVKPFEDAAFSMKTGEISNCQDRVTAKGGYSMRGCLFSFGKIAK